MGGYHAYGIHPDRLFGVGALAPRGLPPFLGGLCGDHSPHRTTMTQTKRCPIFKFGSLWCFSRQSPQESDCEINASFAQGCGCVINASRRCGLLRHRSVLGPEFLQDHRASGPSWPRGHYSTYRSPGVAGRVHGSITYLHYLVGCVTSVFLVGRLVFRSSVVAVSCMY